jgi:hypothetical protein
MPQKKAGHIGATLERVRGIEPIVELARKSLIPMGILDEAGGTGEISVLPFCSNPEGPFRRRGITSASPGLLQVQLVDARATGQKTWQSRTNSRRLRTKTRSDAYDMIAGSGMLLVGQAALCHARIAASSCGKVLRERAQHRSNVLATELGRLLLAC